MKIQTPLTKAFNMANLQINGVVGSDNVAPIRNIDALFTTHALREIFVPGGVGEGRIVPNVDDLVLDLHGDGSIPFQRVIDVDIVTGRSTMVPWNNIPVGSIADGDLLTGVGSMTDPNTFVLLVDKSVTPHTCLVDGRLYFPNPEIASVKVFRGTTSLVAANVISLYYDNQGNLLGNNIPTPEVKLNDNSAPGGVARARYIPTFNTLADLQDNEVVTVIAYSALGHVAMMQQLRVYNTGWLAPRNNNVKEVTHISLMSAFLSEVPDSNLVELPVNVPLQGLYMRGVVHYSDGSKRDYPIDNQRFTVFGLRDYVATSENIQVPFQLRYTLSPDEACYDAIVSGESRYKIERYRVLTKPSVGSYNVKLYCYPVWVDAVQGYTLKFFLYNSERKLKYDVTNLVEYSLNSEPFRPKLYGAQQNLSVALNLGSVSSSYVNYRYNTTVQLVLWRQGTEKQTNWTIAFEPGQDPAFGDGNHGKLKYINSNYYLLKLDSGAANQAEWLDRLYKRTLPIFSSSEIAAPLPSHFRVRVGNVVNEYPLAEWDKTHQVLAGLTYWKTVFIEWVRKTPDSEQELGITGLPLWEDQTLVVPAGG